MKVKGGGVRYVLQKAMLCTVEYRGVFFYCGGARTVSCVCDTEVYFDNVARCRFGRRGSLYAFKKITERGLL